jgi:hypothetical protein
MASIYEPCLAAAWAVFRNWLLLDNLPLTVLSSVEPQRTVFSALVPVTQMSVAMAIQLMLLYHGQMSHPETGEYVSCADEGKKSACCEFVKTVLAGQKLQIAIVQDTIFGMDTKQSTKWETEIRIISAFRGRRVGMRAPFRRFAP